jgi:uridine kinase
VYLFEIALFVMACLVAVVGCTASGKSQLALELAERFDGELVNADAMQVSLILHHPMLCCF